MKPRWPTMTRSFNMTNGRHCKASMNRRISCAYICSRGFTDSKLFLTKVSSKWRKEGTSYQKKTSATCMVLPFLMDYTHPLKTGKRQLDATLLSRDEVDVFGASVGHAISGSVGAGKLPKNIVGTFSVVCEVIACCRECWPHCVWLEEECGNLKLGWLHHAASRGNQSSSRSKCKGTSLYLDCLNNGIQPLTRILLRTREVSTKLRSVTQYPLHG